MSNSAALIALVLATAGTYLSRSGLILALAGRTMPEPVERALGHVGPAVLAALTVNLAVGGDGEITLRFAELTALGLAFGVAWWRKNLLWTVAAGMGVLWILAAAT